MQLRSSHPAWRLLRADNSPLVASFLYSVFIEANSSNFLQSELIVKLDDFLYQLRLEQGEDAFPKSSYAYLEDWAHNDRGWLRKFYPANSEEAAFDLTPATEKALVWLVDLQAKKFIGTESRLLTLFDLLRQIAFGSNESPEEKIAELKLQKSKLDLQILALEKGDVSVMDASAVKDRFMQFNQVARELLGDFRQIEQNFRELDQTVREQIATWEGTKGELLQQIFGEQDAIIDSDQGKTFNAFWEFLMSSKNQEELETLLQQVLTLDAVQSLEPDSRLHKIHYDWLEVGGQTQKMVQKLSSQLHSFLDNQAYLANKLLMQQLEDVLRKAVAIKEDIPRSLNLPKEFVSFIELELPNLSISLPMERKLFSPPLAQTLTTKISNDFGGAVDVSALFDEVFVDELQLKQNITKLLQTSKQVNLTQILAYFPLQLGVAELVSYLSIATKIDDESSWCTIVDDDKQHLINWYDLAGKSRQALVPNIIFTLKET